MHSLFGVIVVLGLSTVHGSILKHYETLHHVDIAHRISKRDTTTGKPTHRQIEFKSHDREFHLFLQKKTSIFSKDFRVVVVNRKNQKRDVDLGDSDLYEGYLLGEEKTSHASVIWEDKNTIQASIQTKDETYIVEPSWRHLPEDANYTMMVYKDSDLDMEDDLGDFCGYVDINKEIEENFGQSERPSEFAADFEEAIPKSRMKRQSGYRSVAKTTCPVLLVADYLFFKEIGQSSLTKTYSYLIGLMDRVDTIYRNTNFDGFQGMGFEIKQMLIHEEATEIDGCTECINGQHYNMKVTTPWETKELLETFSAFSSNDYCLAHLFTARGHWRDRAFLLGLSYMAKATVREPGGICSKDYKKDDVTLYLNTGWSSSLNRYDRRLLTQEAVLVTTHEFGHNWGSEHDPDTEECAPSSSRGGKFIMHTYSVSGREKNNKQFSPCSERSIGQVLLQKSAMCFEVARQAFCGNSRVEGDEECDIGPENNDDPCCDGNCKLRPGKACSDVNYECCVDCQVAPSDVQCNNQTQTEHTCDGPAYCNGTTPLCSEPEHKTNGSSCLERGECQNGRCIAFCEQNGLVSCICDNVDDGCKWCCKKNETAECTPYSSATEPIMNLPNGTSCAQGYCNKGTCVRVVQDLVQRLWDIIENLTPSQFVEIMRANIVGTVIILSLIIWIPVSCIVSWKDRKAAAAEEDQRQWMSAQNPYLVRSTETSQIRPTTQVHSRRTPRVTPRPSPPSYLSATGAVRT